jgi:predicted O-methyltransferase YrrM
MAPLVDRWVRKRLKRRYPIRARHVELSLVASQDDAPIRLDRSLLDLSLRAVRAASEIHLRFNEERRLLNPYVNCWPGENYRLLAGFVQVLKPQRIIEIGTEKGLAALAMKEVLPPGGKILTFDILPWSSESSVITEEDIQSGVIETAQDDLSQLEVARKYASALGQADFIFVDAAKDGVQERLFLDNFRAVGLKHNALLFFDDIRLWNMLKIWREIQRPKLDLTGLGHWSGSGVVLWEG